jgi:hypothetical protein
VIVSHRKYPFGSHVSVIKTDSYNCMISTAPEEIFKGYSIVIQQWWDVETDKQVVAKALLHPNLSKSDRAEYTTIP